MLRVIREVQPNWVVGENVLGLVNWSGGLVFHEVQTDLEAEGYEVFPFVLPACAVNAPHRRDRVWFVAHSNGNGFNQCNGNDEEQPGKGGFNALSNANTGNEYGDAADTKSEGTWEQSSKNRRGEDGRFDNNGKVWDVADTTSKRMEGNGADWKQEPQAYVGQGLPLCGSSAGISNWDNFPTVSPLRMRDDGVSNKLLRFVVNEFYDTNSYTSKNNRIKNLQEVWGIIQQEEIWEQIRGLYSLESKDILFQTMQLYSARGSKQRILSPYSEKFCEPILQHLRKHKEFRCSPQGQELGKQRAEQFGNSLSFLPHEVALAARRFETTVAKFEAWHRNESIKAAGNAIVPQVAFQIFKAIAAFVQK
jgi:site-specific DNA-cytosine methylase